MINRSFHSNKPFLLKPVGKDYLWGGNRLKDDFSKELDIEPLAETWECSTHQDGISLVASGEFCGMELSEVLKAHPEYLGARFNNTGEFPILIKLIDAKEDLSIQVHPTDEYAGKNENGQSGKTEMWYILDAAEDAKLIYGLQHDAEPEEIEESIYNNTIEKYLQKISVKKNDLFYVDAGTIHAIGKGVLLAEIQNNSNLTYRLYDYDRTDKYGCKRELHIRKALEVANLNSSNEPRQSLRVIKYQRGCASELLCRCKYFEVYRLLMNTERCRQMVEYQTDVWKFHVLLCVDGCGSLYYGENEALHFFKGDCIFVPADSVKIRLHGIAQLLDVRG